MISFWGSKSSGKTVFLTALFHSILTGEKKWKIQPLDDPSIKFIHDRWEELVERHVFPQPTTREERDRIFKFGIKRKTLLGMNSKEIELDFLDPAGEFFENPGLDAVHGNIVFNTIKNSRGLICLIDPERKQSEYFKLVLKNFSKIKETFSPQSKFYQIPIPVAICVTKLDANAAFVNDYRKFDAESYAIKLMGEDSYRLLTSFLQIYKFFGVSSMGWDQKEKKSRISINNDGEPCPLGKPEPVNVFNALKWLLLKIK